MLKNEKELGVNPLLIQGGIFTGLFFLLLVFLLSTFFFSINDQLQSGVVAKAYDISVAEQQEVSDPAYAYRAIQLAQFAYQEEDPKSIDIVKNLYELYGQYHFPNLSAGISGNAAGTQQDVQKLFPGICFSLQSNTAVSDLDYYSTLDTSLQLYTLSNSVLKYRPDPRTGREQSLNLKPYLANLPDFEIGLSADGKNLQLRSRYHRAPIYSIDGQVFSSPRLDVYQPDQQQEDQAAAPLDTLERYLGFYNFFTGEFMDKSGNTYTRDNVAPFFAQVLTLSDAGYELQINNGSRDRIQPDSLFSFKLINAANNTLDVEALTRLTAQSWWSSVSQPEISKLLGSNNASPSAQLITLSQNAYPTMWLWDLDSLQLSPTTINLDGPAPCFLTAMTESTLLRVNPDGAIIILDTNLSPKQILKSPGSAILEFLISPDQRHLAYRTASDSVFIWNLWGNLLHHYEQKNIAHFSFSNDGVRLLSRSPEQVAVWAAETHAFQIYERPADAPPVAFARFQDGGQHIVIGLTDATVPATEGKARSLLQQLSFWDQPQDDLFKNRIVYWEPEGQSTVFYDLPPGAVLDATVSTDGTSAVVLQATAATVIAAPNAEKGFNLKGLFQNNQTTIPAIAPDGQLATLSLSPSGTHLVRQSIDKRRLELFDKQGNVFNAYEFPPGFQAGFQGKLFTPDDHFLIAGGSTEMWFWHPENVQSGALNRWTKQFEITRQQKQQYGLTTLADYIPGEKLEAKTWALPLLLIAWLFLVYYFSDFSMQFLQEKNYLEFSLYLGSFLLLLIILIALWGLSLPVPDLDGVAFYGTIWTALLLISVWMFRNYNQSKPVSFFAVCLVGLALIIGSVAFFLQEAAGWDVLLGLLLLLMFIGLVDQPVYRAASAYRQGNSALFYRWLLLPVAGLSLAFWGIAAWNTGDFDGDNTGKLLHLFAGMLLVFIAIKQSREQIKAHHYLSFAAYAVPALLLSLLLFKQEELFVPAIAGSLFLGWRYGQYSKDNHSFWYYSSGLFAGTGAVILALLSNAPLFWGSRFLLTLLFVLLLWGLHKQMPAFPSQRPANQWTVLRGLAIMVIWVLGYAFTVSAVFLVPKKYPYPADLVENTLVLPENDQPTPNPVAPVENTADQPLILAEGENIEVAEQTLPPVVETPPTSPVIALPPVITTPEKPQPRVEAPTVAVPVPTNDNNEQQVAVADTSRVKSIPNPTSQNERRQLIEKLFHRNEGVRRDALNQLAASHKESLALIDELIQATYRHPGMMYGLEKVFELLEMLSDKQLRTKSFLLDAFFKDVYSPQTANSIQALRARIGK